MGAAASAMTADLPERLDKEAAKQLAGASFDEKAFDAAAKKGTVSREDFLEAAAKAVQDELKESRIQAESTTLCAHSGCCFLVTGLTQKYCCKKCHASPGMHGPKCQKKLLPCSTPGCPYAVTGLSSIYCCKMCGKNGQHGPHCWHLNLPTAVEDDDEEGSEEPGPLPLPGGATGALQSNSLQSDSGGSASSALASASMMVAAAATDAADMAEAALPDVSAGEAASEKQMESLIAKVDANQAQLDANAAAIEALRQELGL